MFTDEKINETPVSSFMSGRYGETYQGFTYQGATYTMKGKIVEETEENGGSSADVEPGL